MIAFRSPSFIRRIVALGVLLFAATAVIWGVGKIADLPNGYNGSQSDAACDLATDPATWSDLVDGTTRDLAIFIPSYLVVCLAAVAITSRKPRGDRFRRAFDGGAQSDGIAGLLALMLGLADIIETVLFRRTLERLQAGH